MFKFDRATLSAFYVASWFSFILFSQLLQEQLSQLADILYTFFSRDLGLTANPQSLFWYSMFLAAFLVTFLVTFFITKPLGVYMNNSSNPMWVDVLFLLLVLGFFVYVVNQSLKQPMPAEFPPQIVRLLGGVESISTRTTSSVWSSIAAPLWILSPLGLVFLISRVKPAQQEEGAE